MALELTGVTLCAADTASPPLAARALERSAIQCRFADAILFTDGPGSGGAFRTERIVKFAARADYSRFMLKELHARIETPFALVTQWDGYVIDPSAWSDDFLQYDYIGARWAWHADGMAVGNGGFSLRSRRLLAALAHDEFQVGDAEPEDELIGRRFRPALTARYGIRFAPEALADRFSYERSLPQGPTFGFHGFFNFWRHVEDAEMETIVAGLAPYVVQSDEYLELTARYFKLRKFIPLRSLYARLRRDLDAQGLRSLLLARLGNHEYLTDLVVAGERMLASAPQRVTR